MPWWNTTTDTLERAVIPARTLSVIPGSAPAQPPAPDISLNRNIQTGSSGALSPSTQTSGLYLFWITATAVFAVAWLFSTTMWMRNRRLLAFMTTATPAMMPRKTETTRTAPTPNADSALKVLRTAMSRGSAAEIKRCLIAWGKALYQDNTLLTLGQLLQNSGDAELAALLAELEKSLYSIEAADGLDRSRLEQAVTRVHRLGRSSRNSSKEYSLPPLYKN